MSLRRRLLVFAATQGVAVAMIPVLVGAASTGETVHAFGGGLYTPYWSPTPASAAEGGSITFENASGYNHGIIWKSVPAPPKCDPSVPEGVGKYATSWKGACEFSHSGTYLYYCSFHGESMSGTITVKAPSNPTATTNVQTGVTQKTATFNGTVKPEGTATSYYFAYGTTSAMTETTSPQSVGSDFGEHQVTTSLTNLAPETEYHFKLVATYGATSKAEGSERTFSTLPLEKPKVTTKTVTPKETEAMLEGVIDPGGETTRYSFEYGTSTSYGQKTEEKTLASTVGTQTVSAPLTKLAPSTEYYFRLVAENSKGSGESLGTFKTASPPPPKSEPPTNKEPSPTPTPTPILTPGPIAPEPELAPLVPAIAQGSLKLTAPRPGSSVHGSLTVFSSGAGGRLEIDLIASSASLGKARHKKSTSTVVGRLVRGSVSAGKASFSISLNATAKRALHRRHKLTVTVKITLTPESGSAEVVTKSIVVRA
jgi:plastocyanin